jgi:sodium pump decarboxylase gamma subunit
MLIVFSIFCMFIAKRSQDRAPPDREGGEMTLEETIGQSAILMGFGMGVVFLTLFAFVLIIVFLRSVLGKNDRKNAENPPAVIDGEAQNADQSGSEAVAAATAAIIYHKAR